MDKKNRRIFLPRNLPAVILTVAALSLLAVTCAPTPASAPTLAAPVPVSATATTQPDLARGASLTLATHSENSVEVVIKLQRAADGQVSLTATFTPLEAGYHLYSKDMPRNGVNGLGRPTLLELGDNSKMQAIGALIESVGANVSTADPSGVLIYPDGPVTLTLPVRLPSGYNWAADEISLTYMACSAVRCKAPVMGQVIPIKVPGAEALSN